MLVWASLVLLPGSPTISATAQFPGYDEYIDFHNFGYVLTHQREVTVAKYDAKLIFHLELPRWRIRFRGLNHNCRTNMNTSLICVQLRELLNAVRDVKFHAQLYVQHQIRRIYQMIMDIPIGRDNGRSRRGFLTDSLSKITGLATQDDLRALEHILEQVETGIYQASKMWGDGASSLAASFKLQQDRMRNVFDI